MTRVSERICGWLGWCPNTQRQLPNAVNWLNDNPVIPAAGGSFKDRAYYWLSLFRNQVLLSSIVMSAMGLWMFACLGGWSSPGLFIIGILAGVPFTVATGLWYWPIFNEVLHDGPVVLMNRQDRTSGTLTALGIAVSSIPVLVLFGIIPGMTMEMMPAFMGGFVGVLFWGMFISVLRWESGTRRLLHFDGMILELERERTYAR